MKCDFGVRQHCDMELDKIKEHFYVFHAQGRLRCVQNALFVDTVGMCPAKEHKLLYNSCQKLFYFC